MKVEAPPSFPSPEEVWTSLFESICERIGPCFARSETREGVQAYLKGLLSPVERKNGWQLAEEAGFSTPYAMQYLLNRAVWESDEVRDQLQAYVHEMIGDPTGVYVLDAHGLPQKRREVGRGTKTVEWNGRTRRKLPNRGLFGVCNRGRPYPCGSRAVSAQEVDARSRAMSRSTCARRGGFCHQTTPGCTDAVACLGRWSASQVGNRGLRLWE